MRLQVFLSHNGVCSRRKAMDLIFSGKVMVNGGEIKEPSFLVDSHTDKVLVNGQEIYKKEYDYILLNKPRGYVTTKLDKHAVKTVLDLLPSKFKHLSPVGRLDKETEGLLLLTNDGQLAFQLTHPSFNIEKIYFVKIGGCLSSHEVKQLQEGILLEGEKTLPAKVAIKSISSDQTGLFLTIHEGRKRQIRLMFAHLGHKVLYLKRVSQGPLALGILKTGEWRLLTNKEVQALKSMVN